MDNIILDKLGKMEQYVCGRCDRPFNEDDGDVALVVKDEKIFLFHHAYRRESSPGFVRKCYEQEVVERKEVIIADSILYSELKKFSEWYKSENK